MTKTALLFCFVMVLAGVIPSPAQTTFTEVHDTVGVGFTHSIAATCITPPFGSGAAWADFDNDGDVDLFIVNQGEPSSLFRNDGDTNGDGLPDFIDVAPELGVDETGLISLAVVFADYDNDGDQDLYVAHLGGNTLYRNLLTETGTAGFEDVTEIAGVADGGRCQTASWGDFDQDGWLDLYLAKHFECLPDMPNSRDALYRNSGDGTFADVSQYLCADGTSDCPQILSSFGASAVWFDYDNDNDADLFLGNDYFAGGWSSILWRNDGPDGMGGWIFTDISVESGTNYEVNCHGVGSGDYDNDGWIDITLSSAEGGFLLRNAGDGTFTDVSNEAGVRRLRTPLGDVCTTRGPSFFDYDNDGWLDLSYVCGMVSSNPTPQPNALYRDSHDGIFTDVSVEAGIDDPRRGRNSSICDFNQDGFVDFLVVNYGQSVDLYLNQGQSLGNTNHWLTVTAEGGPGVNRDAIGTRFFLTTPDGITQIREIMTGQTSGGGDYRAAYFGLGEYTTGILVIRWPNGVVDSLGSVAADQHLHISGITGVREQEPITSEYRLLQNYPNPFNPTTTFSFSIPYSSIVNLTVFNLLGEEVATLASGAMDAGTHTIQWDATGQPSGVYFYRLSSGKFLETRKLVLLK